MATFLERAVAALNAAMVSVFDAALAPLLRMPAAAALFVIALITAVALVLLMKRVSNQVRLRHAKRQINAGLFEIRLHADDPSAVWRSFIDVMKQNANYLRLNLLPLLWLTVPLALMVAQLQAFYGYNGLTPGQPALITVESSQPEAALTLAAPREIRIDTEPVRLLDSNTVLWRVTPQHAGQFVVTVNSGNEAIAKTIIVGDAPARRSPLRMQGSFERQWLYPSEPLIADASAITSVAVSYPSAGINILGWKMHWLIVYGACSLVSALLVSRWLGVAI